MKTIIQASNSLRACHKKQAFFYGFANCCYSLSCGK
nr:MAG TPA: hypothetical protein [Caudoviricetes sp.]